MEGDVDEKHQLMPELTIDLACQIKDLKTWDRDVSQQNTLW